MPVPSSVVTNSPQRTVCATSESPTKSNGGMYLRPISSVPGMSSTITASSPRRCSTRSRATIRCLPGNWGSTTFE